MLKTVNLKIFQGAVKETRASICDPLATAKGFSSNDSSHDDWLWLGWYPFSFHHGPVGGYFGDEHAFASN